MRRALFAATGAAALLCAQASMAQAQIADTLELESTPKDYHSPQHFAFELKFGPYSPNIDATAGLKGKTPFADLFNNQYGDNVGKRPPGKVLITLEFDWQFWHPFGSFGLAGSVGYTGRQTHSFEYVHDSVTNTDSPCTVGPAPAGNCVRSSDTTTLNIMPVTLELVYRFDVLALRYSVPIVPYFKGGLGYYFFFMQRGDANLSRALDKDGGGRAIGGTPGFVLHPGVALMLDVFDRSAAHTLDAELGINHTYVFAELNYANITGLGIFKDKIVLSDTTWNVGLAFEF